jgi:hypothetical protein
LGIKTKSPAIAELKLLFLVLKNILKTHNKNKNYLNGNTN